MFTGFFEVTKAQVDAFNAKANSAKGGSRRIGLNLDLQQSCSIIQASDVAAGVDLLRIVTAV